MTWRSGSITLACWIGALVAGTSGCERPPQLRRELAAAPPDSAPVPDTVVSPDTALVDSATPPPDSTAQPASPPCSLDGLGADTLPRFRACLASLPADSNAVPVADSLFKAYFRPASSPLNDSGFVAFRGFYYRVLARLEQSSRADAALQRRVAVDSARQAVRQGIVGNGLDLYDDRGAVVIGEDADYLTDAFAAYLSPTVKQFLTARSQDLKRPAFAGGEVAVSWDELGERVWKWGALASRTGGSSLKPEVDRWLAVYWRNFLVGTQYASAGRPGTVPRAAMDAYQRFVDRHADSNSGRVVAGFLEILKANGGKWTPAIEDYLHQQGIDPGQPERPAR